MVTPPKVLTAADFKAARPVPDVNLAGRVHSGLSSAVLSSVHSRNISWALTRAKTPVLGAGAVLAMRRQ